ncbi:MAG: hypothetical protein J7578_23235 [Chitinophagaceae bacterium]|nr:hypothetical protein [Chitinophagaceae bacterium]
MKKVLLPLFAFIVLAVTAEAQNLAPDQNPRYMESQQRYMRMADSINAWHSTTPQETYKAIDYLQDKRDARAARKAFRRELRMERARWNNDFYYGYGGYYNYNNYYPHSYYGYRSNWNNYFWNSLPLITAVGLASWWR